MMTRLSDFPRLRTLLPGARLAAFALAIWPALAAAVLPIEHWTTKSGARVYFVHAPSIPMLDVSVSFDAGNRFNPPDKEGVGSLTNSLLAKGTRELDESQIAERFAVVGAERGGGAGDDRAVVSLRTLTSERELASALDTLAKILAEPSFPAEVLAREKERTAQALREAQTKPDTIARQTFGALLYPEHPYGRHPTPESIGRIGRDDLVAFYRARYGASRAVVAMIGAISRARAELIAEQLSAKLPKGEPPPKLPAVAKQKQGRERRIEHPASQSHILIGTPGFAWGDPDQFPLFVGNYVLGGGGFVSRLYDEVREKRGLAYSVYSYFSPSLQPGPFALGLQTQKEQTDDALKVVRDTLGRFLEQGPTEQELVAAKANLVGGFPLRIDSNRKIVDYLGVIGYYGLPLDYLETWTQRVERVSVAQVREAFARHIRLDALATVVVGAGGASR